MLSAKIQSDTSMASVAATSAVIEVIAPGVLQEAAKHADAANLNVFWHRVLHLLEVATQKATFNVGKGLKSAFMQGNYAPVGELHKTNCEVTGELPTCLDGIFMQNGPNPYFPPLGDYHWFDGDGMIHGTRIKDGKAKFCNRWVETSRLKQEKAAGRPLFSKIGDLQGAVLGLSTLMLRTLKEKLGYLSMKDGDGVANTALVYHAQRLMALHEGDVPYQLRVLCNGIIETIGTVTYGGKCPQHFTAHPKVDPCTGELIFVSYDLMKKPYITVGTVSATGKLLRNVPVNLRDPVMIHDLAITKNYIIILDMPLVFRPQKMMSGGMPFVYEKNRGSRFGLLRRDAVDDSDILWFSMGGCMMFHTASAWEEGDTVTMCAVAFDNFSLDFEVLKQQKSDFHPRMHSFEFNLRTGSSSKRLLSSLPVDFPVIDNSCLGSPTRYCYTSIANTTGNGGPFVGLAKMDMAADASHEALVGQLYYGKDKYGGEASFVPRPGATAPDDGYLLVYVHDESDSSSKLVVFDAASMRTTPVASVAIPQRVPYGFHAMHMTEEQLQQQTAERL